MELFLEKAKQEKEEVREEKKQADAVATWRADSRRPTFARVFLGDGNALELVSLQVTVTVEGLGSLTNPVVAE